MGESEGSNQSACFDDVIKSLGEFGRYQKRLFFAMCVLPMSVGIQAIITVFTMATPEHRCRVPEVANDTFSSWGPSHDHYLNNSIPWEEDALGKPLRSHCLLYRNRNHSTSEEELLSNRSTTSCDSWLFDHSTFTLTFTEQASLVCERHEYHANADMIYMVGLLWGSIICGIFSDRYGRKKALLATIVLHMGTNIGIAFATTYAAYAALRFFSAIANMGVFLACYVLALELVGGPYRTLAGSILQMFWPVGLFTMIGAAYGLRDWRHLQLAMSCPSVLFISFYWLVNESPRWLASKNRNEEADAILQQIARVNGKPPPPPLQKEPQETEALKENPLRMFTNRTTLTRTLIVFLNWVVVTLVYYGLSLNVGSLGPNIFLNSFLSSLAELLGYTVALLGLDRLGRKVMHCGSMIVGGLACLASMFPVMYGDPDVTWPLLLLSNVGKLGASASFSIIYLFSAELFPTVVRNSFMGASSMVARLGGIVSPYIAQLNILVGGKLGVALPLVVFGGSALVAGVLALMLPETLNKALPETIDDAIHFGKKEEPRREERYTMQKIL